ncbi:uncharacterized protein BJ171DRAFT_422644 [Polychytrium aggregatum]|uniref:uncharacterized protein n=1 Tax=Polychytrium aggregatum TaxID=110093 RepID=UPI0022FF1A0C|nr:uncharacterized protein BJ171DRAFT_422644 [Polychytrium aggregatum]KAI9205844.1 hypothetical protein BJ171DRAFT_422644 [Polychytrium aggregatum]
MPDIAQLSLDYDPDIVTIICCNDGFQHALDLNTIKTLLRVCSRVRPLLSSKVSRFHGWCQNAGLYNPDGQLRIGLTPSDQIAISLHCDDQDTANRSWLAAQADRGNAAASYFLARILQVDLDKQQSADESDRVTTHNQTFRHLQRAANANHTIAQFHLARCYHDGTGVDRNHTKAVELYRTLADRGIPQTQISLGRCYENGEGVDQDYDAAIEWYSKAADQGNWLCRHLMAVCVFLEFGYIKDKKEAAGIFEQLANEGHSDSQLWIGVCYCYGQGVSKDKEKAFEWLSKSADQDNSYGQWMVGMCYCWGYGVDKDHSKEVEWYRKSAEQGNRYGQNALGYCYHGGRGVPEDIDTAVFWYRKSADQGYEGAIDKLKELGKWP